MRNLAGLIAFVVIFGCCLTAGLSARADTYFFDDNDRAVLLDYYKNTTMPATPNEAMSYYEPGTTLPDKVTYTELPADITAKLKAAPPGDEYVSIDRNYYLIDQDKRLVIAAVKNE